MCNEGGEKKFMKKEVDVTCKSSVILKGKRDTSAGLWLALIGLPVDSANSVGKVINKHSEK